MASSFARTDQMDASDLERWAVLSRAQRSYSGTQIAENTGLAGRHVCQLDPRLAHPKCTYPFSRVSAAKFSFN